MPTVFDAIEFAARAHAGQYRKGTRIPYIVHPLAVARALIECDASDPVVIAGVLHDVIEDTPVTLAEIDSIFGGEVAHLVEAVTEPNRSDVWEKRKQDNLDFLESAAPEVVLIELADKLDNIRGIHEEHGREGNIVWKRFNRGADKQKWYYERLEDLFSRRIVSGCGALLTFEFRQHVQALFGCD